MKKHVERKAFRCVSQWPVVYEIHCVQFAAIGHMPQENGVLTDLDQPEQDGEYAVTHFQVFLTNSNMK